MSHIEFGKIPVFPIWLDNNGVPTVTKDGAMHSGLSAREYYSALAMQGIMANPCSTLSETKYNAEMAIANADALLKELHDTD